MKENLDYQFRLAYRKEVQVGLGERSIRGETDKAMKRNGDKAKWRTLTFNNR